MSDTQPEVFPTPEHVTEKSQLRAEDYVGAPEKLLEDLREKGAMTFDAFASGMFPASELTPEMAEQTGMDLAWFRDNAHVANALYESEEPAEHAMGVQAGQAVLAVLSQHKLLLDAVVSGAKDPADSGNRLPVRVNGHTLEVDQDDLDHPRLQNDATGYALWLSSRLLRRGDIASTDQNLAVMAQTAKYLGTVRYWEDYDDGHWEEDLRLQRSSIGVAIAGLREARSLLEEQHYDQADDVALASYILRGQMAMDTLQSRGLSSIAKKPTGVVEIGGETYNLAERRFDAAELFLAEPLQQMSATEAVALAERLTPELEGDHGFARYPGDTYWSPKFKDVMEDERSRTRAGEGRIDERNMIGEGVAHTHTEAQWTLFDPVIATIYGRAYLETNDETYYQKQLEHLDRSLSQLMEQPDGSLRIPEAYYFDEGSDGMMQWLPNDHVPLLWSQANLHRASRMFAATTHRRKG